MPSFGYTHFEDIRVVSLGPRNSRADRLNAFRVPAILSHRSLLMTQPWTGSAVHFSEHEA